MGWSTRIMLASNFGGEFFWGDFNKSIEVIEWNKTYLSNHMDEVIDNFPGLGCELRYKTDDPEYDDGDGYHYCGWYYCELTKEVLEELSKPDNIERFADMYEKYSWGFKNKKERKEFIKDWKDTLKACKFFSDKRYTKIYWVEG